LSNEHFSVDGILIEAWASMKRFKPKDREGARTIKLRRPPAGGIARRIPNGRLQGDPCLDDLDAKLYRKGPAWKPGLASSDCADGKTS
jgi:hypothetical protein